MMITRTKHQQCNNYDNHNKTSMIINNNKTAIIKITITIAITRMIIYLCFHTPHWLPRSRPIATLTTSNAAGVPVADSITRPHDIKAQSAACKLCVVTQHTAKALIIVSFLCGVHVSSPRSLLTRFLHPETISYYSV